MKLKRGDKIIVDFGGIELCRGVVHNPDDRDIDNKSVISFVSRHGWRHMEYCQPHQIMKINKEWQLKRVPQIEQPFAACDKCNRLKSGDRYQLGGKTYCEVCLEEMGVKV